MPLLLTGQPGWTAKRLSKKRDRVLRAFEESGPMVSPFCNSYWNVCPQNQICSTNLAPLPKAGSGPPCFPACPCRLLKATFGMQQDSHFSGTVTLLDGV